MRSSRGFLFVVARVEVDLLFEGDQQGQGREEGKGVICKAFDSSNHLCRLDD